MTDDPKELADAEIRAIIYQTMGHSVQQPEDASLEAVLAGEYIDVIWSEDDPDVHNDGTGRVKLERQVKKLYREDEIVEEAKERGVLN